MQNYATNIALVDRETGAVQNVIWGMVYQLEEFSRAGQTAVQIDDLAVGIGDRYDGGHFWHGDAMIQSREEELASLRAELARLKGENA